ncbi:hypothetical protein NEFER03_2182 [Nematocida sp. LUAm3]|nr:hypothetical protein NEFER03_2182 [Nematocida sp. LUAm3]KAI5176290.1 hypothetical protein NEFER02_2082 [Nematocida sp. LUAm2]KAI5179238.1 hypothetical protein NEFER01_2092 [Nematocida sp. LUAm1]
MGYSQWYLENLNMQREQKIHIKKAEEIEVDVDMLGEVFFDMEKGPVVKVPSHLPEEDEEIIAFSSLPDIRSLTMSKEAFIFTWKQKAYHVAFVQAPSEEAKRGYVQKSLFVRCNRICPSLSKSISNALKGPEEYNIQCLTKILVETDSSIFKAPCLIEFSLITENKKDILDGILRGKSFLVLGKSPTEVSDAVSWLSMLPGFLYGGDILPYKSSFIHIECTSGIIGGTNEHIFKKEEYDNIIDLIKGKYSSKKKRLFEDPEWILKELNKHFTQAPEAFQIPGFLKHMDKLGITLRERTGLREFFSSSNFSSWLLSVGYKNMI